MLSKKEEELIKKYESKKNKTKFKDKYKMYQELIDKNYKDGDRN